MTDLDLDLHQPEPVPPRTPMIGVVVVTHGQLATELVNAAEMIVGDLPHFVAVSIGWHDDVETAKEAIGDAIVKVDRPTGVIVLTDMFGGTPANLGMTFMARHRVEVITGVNLPMLIKLAGLRHESNLVDVARQIGEAGRNAIWVPSDLMRTGTPADGKQGPT
jgi:PTS system mannose-specific IIA component